MMYIHYCKHCDRIHMLSGHKSDCPACDKQLVELPVSFLEYQSMNEAARQLLRAQCRMQENRSALPHK